MKMRAEVNEAEMGHDSDQTVDSTDGAAVSRMAVITLDAVKSIKGLDANRYATKKTIAQGMLDIALLTANASQLKYILQVGEKHEFYTLLLTLITVSIVLQMLVGIMFVAIGGLNINKNRDLTAATILNDVILIFIFIISIVNVSAGCLFVILGSFYDLNKPEDHKKSELFNNICLALNIVILAVDVIINVFFSVQDDTKMHVT